MKLQCPISTCRADNDALNETCIRCGTPVREYFRLLTYPARLFNQGLQDAQAGHMTRARDLFAAVVNWCPRDREARSALGAACFALGDGEEAQRQWETVLRYAPSDAFATQGLAILAAQAEQTRKSENGKQPAAKKRNRSRK